MLAGESGNINAGLKAIEYLNHSYACIHQVIFNNDFGTIRNGYNINDIYIKIDLFNYDTSKRRNALDKFGEMISGQVISTISKEDACELIKKSM
ncbi:hypothetical protein L0B53_09310 [Vibrio sp. SS-MA-C1-2]|uniref:hypothetical protein n=1 Tax=Vibrio sp. SS-MA-C1-2 TaxID=2908646 RepID=UPI001F276D8C|nr:hypothetical protein [Vibrio sp. SS-MA-C1-2]UJF19675.1 hypothetical protein L0B53_09310 [Vibrio sp. SS-MA-C1-2]